MVVPKNAKIPSIDRVVLAERLFKLYRECPITGCWLWVGALDGNGYGHCWVGNGHTRAHRAVFWACGNHLESHLVLDHLCRNRRCVNPDHLELVTQTENVMRGTSPWAERKKRTHCPQGHEYSKENTRFSKFNQRICRKCDLERHLESYKNNPEKYRARAKSYRDKE